MKLLTLTLFALSCFGQTPALPYSFKVNVAQMRAWGFPFAPDAKDHIQAWSPGWGALDEVVRIQIDVTIKGDPRSYFQYVRVQDGIAVHLFYLPENLADIHVVRTIGTRVSLGESFSSDGPSAK